MTIIGEVSPMTTTQADRPRAASAPHTTTPATHSTVPVTTEVTVTSDEPAPVETASRAEPTQPTCCFCTGQVKAYMDRFKKWTARDKQAKVGQESNLAVAALRDPAAPVRDE